MTIAEQVGQLNALRQQCAENLTAKGVETASTEGFDTLVPKILDVPAGGGVHKVNVGASSGSSIFGFDGEKVLSLNQLTTYSLSYFVIIRDAGSVMLDIGADPIGAVKYTQVANNSYIVYFVEILEDCSLNIVRHTGN